VQGSGGPLSSVSVAHCARVAKLKINVTKEKFILAFAVILVKQCRNKQWQQYQQNLGLSPLSAKSYKALTAFLKIYKK